jgi:NAD(P)-dependent dehydrogenase (short-subunit alcohol dehydrogenase family)
MDLELAGRVAVVTGASKGIGFATTEALLAEGVRVVAGSRTAGPDLDALAGPALRHIPVDLTDPDAPARLVRAADETFGGVDVLVNNAGGPPPGRVLPSAGFLGITDEQWHAMVDFNLLTAVRCARAAIPIMLRRGGGAIVNVSSTHAHQPSAVNVDYGAAKAAMNNLTQALSEEFAPQGIRVNTVSPGPVRTPWWTDAGGAADVLASWTGTSREEVLGSGAASMMNLTTGRLIEPPDVAAMIVHLVSPRSSSTTGADVLVDAGFVKTV